MITIIKIIAKRNLLQFTLSRVFSNSFFNSLVTLLGEALVLNCWEGDADDEEEDVSTAMSSNPGMFACFANITFLDANEDIEEEESPSLSMLPSLEKSSCRTDSNLFLPLFAFLSYSSKIASSRVHSSCNRSLSIWTLSTSDFQSSLS